MPCSGIRAPRTSRSPSDKGESFGIESADFASRRYMQRDIEFEVDSIDKSGGFIGALYFNKTENVAITLVKEGLATVHDFSAEGLPWARQLYDAEVRPFIHQGSWEIIIIIGGSQESKAECPSTTILSRIDFLFTVDLV
jgi:hypothetical protein